MQKNVEEAESELKKIWKRSRKSVFNEISHALRTILVMNKSFEALKLERTVLWN